MTTLMMVVAGLLTDPAGRVLVQRRPAGAALAGLWEFPGGKVEAGETPEAALARELDEELGIAIDPATCTPFAFASEPLDADRHLLLLLLRCAGWRGEPRALQADELRWLQPHALADLAMPAPDRPLVVALLAATPPR